MADSKKDSSFYDKEHSIFLKTFKIKIKEI